MIALHRPDGHKTADGEQGYYLMGDVLDAAATNENGANGLDEVVHRVDVGREIGPVGHGARGREESTEQHQANDEKPHDGAGEGLKFTFHRAIDACVKPFEAVEQLIELGFDKILTSGGKPTALEGVPMIAEMQLRYGDKIGIMPGGGINLGNVKEILDMTGAVHCHASLAHWVPRFNEKLYPNQKDATGATMVWTESNRDLIYEMEKMLNPF